MNEIKFIPIYNGKFNKVAKPSLIKRILKELNIMKIRKRAEQKNFIVNIDYYNDQAMKELITKRNLFKVDENDSWRISANELKEIKICLDEYGYYETVGIDSDGNIIHICI